MAHRAEPEAYVRPDTLDRKCAEWLDAVAGLNREVEVEPKAAALLVIDMQRFFFEPPGAGAILVGDTLIPRVTQMAGAFRRAGRPVVFTRHGHRDRADTGMLGEWWRDFIADGTGASRLVPEMMPVRDEPVIVKNRNSAFRGTGLEELLRRRNVNDLVIAGVMTNLCCETTARDAFVRDFRVFFLADATAAATEAMHQASLLNLAYGFARVTTVAEVAGWLRVCQG